MNVNYMLVPHSALIIRVQGGLCMKGKYYTSPNQTDLNLKLSFDLCLPTFPGLIS